MRMLGRIFLLLLVLCLGVAGWQWWGYSHRQLVAPNAEVVFDVPRGHAGTRLAEVLQQAGVDVPSWKMALALRLRGDAARIKAGNYLITGPATLQGLLDELVSGQQEKGKLITLVEGWNMRDLRAALKKAPDLNDTLSGLSDAALMEKLGMPGVNPEGRFAPDTYAYRPGSDDVELLRRALVLQQRRLDAAWENRATDSPLKTPAELLTLASVVEKETGHALDREMVASVFTNRLRKGMPLQSDPTTIYGLGERFDGNLRKKDLRDPSPYNTYVHRGLPPSPISLPGLHALQATARPAQSDKLYFVARGDGRSEFSADLASHNRAVDRFQRRAGGKPLKGTAAAGENLEEPAKVAPGARNHESGQSPGARPGPRRISCRAVSLLSRASTARARARTWGPVWIGCVHRARPWCSAANRAAARWPSGCASCC